MGPSPDEVFDREIRWGIQLALTGEPVERRIFSVSFEDALGAPPAANIPISEMLEAMAERPDLRAHLREAAANAAEADSRFKRAAAVVRILKSRFWRIFVTLTQQRHLRHALGASQPSCAAHRPARSRQAPVSGGRLSRKVQLTVERAPRNQQATESGSQQADGCMVHSWEACSPSLESHHTPGNSLLQ